MPVLFKGVCLLMGYDSEFHDRIAAHLGDTHVLHCLSEETRRRVAQYAIPMELMAGEILCQAGDPGDAVYVVQEGEIEILSRTPEGFEVRLAALGHGAIIGEMAALEGTPRSLDMVATRHSKLYRIPRAALLEVLLSDPEAALQLIFELSRRLRASNTAIEAMMRLGLSGRLARLLTSVMNARGLVSLTQTELARQLGVSREKVNRRLKAWAMAGIVEVAAAGIRVSSPDRLRQAMNTARRHHV
jgi:CRP/FNR family cyclic AMP-dependent transcriptional regulator